MLLITDPWQLQRASRAFAQQHLAVIPLAAEPEVPPQERNRLALRGIQRHERIPLTCSGHSIGRTPNPLRPRRQPAIMTA